MRINRKGFTLIEFLAVVAVISIILVLSFREYSSYLKSSKEKLKKIEEERIIDAGSMYYTEFKDSDDYKSFVNNEDNSVNSCIGINTLISKGFYKGKVKFIDDNNFNLVKVKEINGVPSYELVSYKDSDPKLIEDCIGEEIIRLLDSGTVVSMSSGEEGEVTLETSINSSGNNQYSLSLVVKQKNMQTIVEHVIPLYVMVVLDASESMRGDRYTNATSAAIQLSSSIVGAFDNSQVGLITFNSQSTLQRGFAHSPFIASNFPELVIYTNIISALDMAQAQLSGVGDAIKYVIFLTDGYPQVENNNVWAPPACVYFDDACKNAIRTSASNLRNTGSNLVFIGYEINNDPMYSAQDLLLYKEIASVDETGTICPTSDYTDLSGNKHCYYNSTSSNISNLFSSISTSIQNTVNNQKISRSVINATLDKSIKVYDNNGNEITDLVIDIDFSNSGSGTNNEYEYTYSFTIGDLNENDFVCDANKNECTYESNLFEEYSIKLYDIDNNSYKEVTLDNSPIVTIKKELGSYLN